MPRADTLSIAEIPYESGRVRFRYARYPVPGGGWVRHGLFRAYHEDGTLAGEGTYEHGLEDGPWKDYHDNGRLAAVGRYRAGQEHGVWKFYDADGNLESQVRYRDGVEQDD